MLVLLDGGGRSLVLLLAACLVRSSSAAVDAVERADCEACETAWHGRRDIAR